MKKNLAYLISLIVILMFILSGCTGDDDPITPHEEHFDAVGVYLSSSGIKVASILRGETSDTISVPLNASTSHIEVQFYNEEENIIDPPAGGVQTLSWEIDDETVTDVFQDPGKEGEFEFYLQGKKEGLTAIELFIMHDGHADFRSGKIPVVVK